MANKLTAAQRSLVLETLNLDKAANYSRLEYYLKQIISGYDVSFETRSSDPLVVPSGEAWEIIVTWSQSEGSLPVGDRKSFFNAKSRATKLLNYLETNVSGKTAEAAANYQLILEQARYPAPPISAPAKNPQEANFQKILNLRRLQTEILQAGIIGKIYTNLEKSKILEGVPKESRTRVLQMFAAGSQNFRVNPQNPTQNFTPEKLHQLLLHTPGVKDVNQIIRLLYSESVQNTDLKTLTETIESSIQSHYGGDESKYQIDMSSLRSLSSMSPGLGSISFLVDSLNISSTTAERDALIKSIRSTIIASASSGQHLDGNSLIQNAIRSAGFPEISLEYFQSLAPYVEEIEVEQRHLLLGSNLGDHDSRLLATSSLAAEIGVDLTIPWLKKGDLEKVTEKLTGSKSVDSLQKTFDLEYARGNDANLQRLSELTILMGKHVDHKTYQDAVGANLGFKLQEMFSKVTGNYLAIRQPIDKFTQKTWGGISNIDDLIHYPQHKLAKWIEKATEKYPWLNPGAYIANKWVKYQTGIALNIHKWAIGVSAGSWFKKSGFAGHIADFTEGFIKHEASWSGATTFFVQRKVGNVLDWSTKILSKGKHATTKSLKISIANTIWNGFSKVAPELSAKMMASAFGATIKTFLLGELTLGATVAIQVGWEAVKSVFSGLIKFVKSISTGDANNLWGMGAMALGSLFIAFNTLLGGIPAAIIISFKVLGAALKIIWDLFLGLLALSALVTVSMITFFTLIWFGLISPTFDIDSGAGQVISSILCDQNSTDPGGASSGNQATKTAACIVKILSDCAINPLTSSNANSSKWQCALASLVAQDAMDTLKASATNYSVLQCVGFVAAIDVAGGGTGSFPNAKDMDTIHPSNYKYVQGVGSCSPGDIFVDKGGAWGHTGIFLGVNGPTIKCMDANGGGPGVVRGESTCTWLASKIHGCLKRI